MGHSKIIKNCDSQALTCIKITWRACWNRFLGPISRMSDSVGLGWGLRTCVSNKMFRWSFWSNQYKLRTTDQGKCHFLRGTMWPVNLTHMLTPLQYSISYLNFCITNSCVIFFFFFLLNHLTSPGLIFLTKCGISSVCRKFSLPKDPFSPSSSVKETHFNWVHCQ